MFRCNKFLVCISILPLLFTPRLLAGDLGRLTKEQVASGYGQLQEAPASPPPENQSSPIKSNSAPRRPQWATSCDHRDDDELSSQCLKLAFGVVGAAAYGVAQKVDPPGISLWEVQQIPREFQFNTIWYFESRKNQQLLVGQEMSNASRFDWTGTPGFQVRIASQPVLRLGQEFLFDYAKQDELFSFSKVTDFATIPNILLPSTQEQSGSGEWNYQRNHCRRQSPHSGSV